VIEQDLLRKLLLILLAVPLAAFPAGFARPSDQPMVWSSNRESAPPVLDVRGANSQTASKRQAGKPKAAGLTRGPKLTRAEIREAEQRLSDLGYWLRRIDGVADVAFRHALIAFQKVQGRARTGRLTVEELTALRTASRPSPVQGGDAHVEIDLSRQVLFIVDNDGRVSKILPVSTGNGEWFTSDDWTRQAITPCGRFKIYRKLSGWRESDLGKLYYPNYIVGGIAIHGSPSIPTSPASHGCIRIPMFAARQFSELTPTGTLVIVHEGWPHNWGFEIK
jgi:lipoprotein-anchoring transpeptidase ErfK/SrfK